MQAKRYTKEQIIGILKEHEAGIKVADLVRKHGYRSKASIGGSQSTAVCRGRKQSGCASWRVSMHGCSSGWLKAEQEQGVASGCTRKKVVRPAARKRLAGQLVRIRRKALHYQVLRPARDAILVARLKALGEQYPRDGDWLLHSLLRAKGLGQNQKRTYRL